MKARSVLTMGGDWLRVYDADEVDAAFAYLEALAPHERLSPAPSWHVTTKDEVRAIAER